MSIKATAKSTITPAPAGVHQAVCVDVIDQGIIHSEKFNSSAHKIDVVFQLNQVNPENGKRFLVRKRFTLSISPKATLRTFLEAWRAKQFTKEELADGFDVEKLIGINCLLNIVHNDDWANIASIMPLPSNQAKIVAENYTRQTATPTHSGQPEMEVTSEAVEIGTDKVPF